MRFAPLALFALLALGSCASCATPPAAPFDAHPPDTDTGETRMAAFTFTADAGTDQLTIAAHGLNTGDGPVATRNVGGTLPAATPAIGPLLDRWVIRVDANTIKLAASSSDAFANTAINITTNGTGTNILEIGVPYRRPRTYAAGVQIRSADLNAYSDAFVAIHDLFTGQSESVWSGNVTLAGALAVGGAVTVTGATTANGALNIANLITEAGSINATLNSATNNDDFTSTGIGTASIVRLATTSGAAPLGGLNAGVVTNRIVMLVNVASASITVKHESGTSSAQFRFSCPNAADLVLRQNGAVRAWYDTASLRWRLLAI